MWLPVQTARFCIWHHTIGMKWRQLQSIINNNVFSTKLWGSSNQSKNSQSARRLNHCGEIYCWLKRLMDRWREKFGWAASRVTVMRSWGRKVQVLLIRTVLCRGCSQICSAHSLLPPCPSCSGQSTSPVQLWHLATADIQSAHDIAAQL